MSKCTIADTLYMIVHGGGSQDELPSISQRFVGERFLSEVPQLKVFKRLTKVYVNLMYQK